MDFSAFHAMDEAVSMAVRSVASPLLTRVMWLATVSGDSAVMTTLSVLAFVLLWAWGRRRPAVVLAVLMAADPLIVSVLKGAFGRARPPLAWMLVGPPSAASFPSGHATASFVFYGSLALIALGSGLPPRRKALAVTGALAAAFLIGASRVYLGVHWASDVLAGWVFAAVLVAMGQGALVLWRRVRGPGRARATTPEHRPRLNALTAIAAAVAVGALLLQTYADPLLRG